MIGESLLRGSTAGKTNSRKIGEMVKYPRKIGEVVGNTKKFANGNSNTFKNNRPQANEKKIDAVNSRLGL